MGCGRDHTPRSKRPTRSSGAAVRRHESDRRLPPSSRLFAEFTPFRRVRPFRRDDAFRRVHPLRRVHPFPPSSPPCRFCRGPPPRDVHPPSGVVRRHPTRRSSSPWGERACCRMLCCNLQPEACYAFGFGCRIEGIFPALKFPGRFPGSRVRQAARGKSREACASAVRLTSPPVTRPGSGAFWWSSLGTRRGSGRAAARGPVSRQLRRPHVTGLRPCFIMGGVWCVRA